MKKSYYPLVSVSWVRSRCLASDLELALAHMLDFVQSDGSIAQIWKELRKDSILRLHENLDAPLINRMNDKYFSLLFLYLYEHWFAVELPRTALESLILDFQDSGVIGVGDGLLPSLVAGMSETVLSRNVLEGRENFVVNVRIWTKLSSYALELRSSDVLSPLLE